jgi:poly-gamma-glutamate synthesis protein (capsule biosynthesis protein)
MLKLLIPVIAFHLYFSNLNAASSGFHFTKACESGEKLIISAVGDVLLHKALQMQAFESADRFISIWEEAIPYFRQADISYANLEGTVAKDLQCNGNIANRERNYVAPDCRKESSSVYTSFPMFNYHPDLIDDLKDSGIDIVSTANNHTLDRFSRGIDMTIEALEDARMNFTGTRKKGDQNSSFYTITNEKGFKIAWLSCTYGTNGFEDKYNQVLYCFKGNQVENQVRALKDKADAVIVLPHWGDEFDTSPSQKQKSYARRWLDTGATAVIGAHPHILQPWEKYKTTDGRETVIVYSLGNFVSNHYSGPSQKRHSIIFYLGLTKKAGKTWINGVRYVPTHMHNEWGNQFLRVDSLMNLGQTKNNTLDFINRLMGSDRRLTRGQSVITNRECY